MRMTVSETVEGTSFNHSRCGGPIAAMRSEGQSAGGPTIQFRGKEWQIYGKKEKRLRCGYCGKEGWFQNYPDDNSSNYVDLRRPRRRR